MSNRGRQNVASFLTQNLNVDWRHGAAYFEEACNDVRRSRMHPLEHPESTQGNTSLTHREHPPTPRAPI